MLPVIKIRLYNVRRNLVANIFQFGYPVLMVVLLYFLFSSILSSSNAKLPGETKYNTTTIEKLIDKNFVFTVNQKIAVITNDSAIKEEFPALILEKDEKNISIHCFNCTVKVFNSLDDFNTEINNDTYKNEVAYNSLIEIEKSNDMINFKFKDQFMEISSVYNEANSLSFNSTILTGGFRKFTNAYYTSNYHQLFANFLIRHYKKTEEKQLAINYKRITTKKLFNMLTDSNFIALLPVYISISYSAIFFAFIMWMITEKEKKLNELLNRQGISNTTYLFSWLATFLILTIIPTVISTLFINFVFLHHSRILLLSLFQILYIIDLFAMCFFLQSFIEKIQTGNTLIKVVYIGVLVLAFVVARPEIPTIAKYCFSLFPQVSQVVSLQNILILDNFDTGIDYTLFTTKYNSMSLLDALIFYIISILLFLGLGFFITLYKNSGLGFVEFVKSLFTCKQRTMDDYKKVINEKEPPNLKVEINHQELSQKNKEYKNSRNYLNITDVTRLYGDLKAVNCFNGELFPNEIFCLLGHNGAGKTTLIKMISGIEDPDQGDIFLDNISLVTNKSYLFQNIGLCMQEDIFFEYLTVREHLSLMCEIKGQKANPAEINDLITRIGLLEKADAQAKTLSGGQKRKLCIALALIGRSKLILLDEPTSGMDVIAKRALWEFLKGYKDNKIIILTTHSLDEAEYLGDRIGIMNEGVYLCSGTSSYLKSKYPCGYNINLIIDPKVFTNDKRNNIYKKLKSIDNSAVIKISSKFVLSINFMNISNNINEIFKAIDEVKIEYGIENYTVSTTTLEDVFIKINSNELSEDMFNVDDSSNAINNNEIKPTTQDQITNVNDDPIIVAQKQGSFFEQLWANVSRQFLSLLRNFKLFILEIIAAALPCILYSVILKNVSALLDSYSYQDVNYLLNHNTVYYKMFGEDLSYITDSTLFKSMEVNLKEFTAVEVNEDDTIDNINDNYYSKDKYKFFRSIFTFSHNKVDNTFIVNNLFQADSPDYYQATMNFILSAFFEKEYGIKASFSNVYAKVPLGSKDKLGELVGKIIFAIMSMFMIWMSFLQIGGYMISGPLKERITNVKHLLFLSGSNMLSYWLGFITIDFVKYLILCVILLPFLVVMESYFWWYIFLFIFFIIAINIFTYCFSFMFSKEESGQKYYILIVVMLCFFLPMATFIRLAANETINTFIISNQFYFTESDLVPPGTLILMMMRMYFNHTMKMSIAGDDTLILIGYSCIIFCIQIVFYGGILFLLEKRVLGYILNKILIHVSFSNDKKVVLARAQIEEENNTNVPLVPQSVNVPPNQYVQNEINKTANSIGLTTVIRNLQKTFFVCCGKHVRAVNKLYLGLEANEKFGLLGFNGSGKTTTFKAITNEIFYDQGTIQLFGYDSQKDFPIIRRSIGYCSQENALFDYLSVSEVMSFYKQLKNVPEPVENICRRFGLEKYLKTQCINLSGGNKRKLAFAIALMNYPKLLLLDEPSTGVDPESRRVMWKNINVLSRNSNTYNMILSTHSMEEAEILCDTVSWLKEGNFVCIGNPEKLKLQFSAGYNLHVKFNAIDNVNSEMISKVDLKSMLIMSNEVIDAAVAEKKDVMPYLEALGGVVSDIKEECESIQLFEVRNDYSFELSVHVNPQKQGDLFAKILNMKNENNSISEISISIQSLENILTKN